MKSFRIDNNVKKLLDMIYAPMYTKTLFVAIELEVFSELKDAKTYQELAEKINLHSENTKFLLDALVGMELLEKENGLYKNMPLSSKYLVRGDECFIGDHLRVYNINAGFDNIDMIKLIKEGPNSDNTLKKGLDAYGIFGDWTEMLKADQRGGRSKEIADLVSALPEFKNFKKMLDLGGGPGLISISIINKHPIMKGVIFDTPDVCRSAQESVEEYHMKNRMEVIAGDYLKDSIGEGYDFILAIGTLNFAKHDIDNIIRKIYEALNPNGVFMCISDGLTHERTRPADMFISWLPSFLRGFDFSLEQGEISDVALQNGFKSVFKQTIPMLSGVMDVDIARK